MARTTIGNTDALPDEVERLIDRKLRLMRRQAESRLGSVKASMGQAVATHVRDGLKSGRNKAAIQLRTSDAYHEAVMTVTQITSEWRDSSETADMSELSPASTSQWQTPRGSEPQAGAIQAV